MARVDRAARVAEGPRGWRIRNVSSEMALNVLAYNMKRVSLGESDVGTWKGPV